jgi:hypothetical protein
VSQIPWWGLPLLAAVFALAGAVAARLLTVRRSRWYDERKTAYVELLAVFERVTYRLRAAYDAEEKPGPAQGYIEEVGPALMRVRLLASGPVRSEALAVHVLLHKLHGEMNPTSVPGVQPQIHFRELLAQVPLVMQQLEASIREELSIDVLPPPRGALLNGHLRDRARTLLRRPARGPAVDDHGDIGQDLNRGGGEAR